MFQTILKEVKELDLETSAFDRNMIQVSSNLFYKYSIMLHDVIDSLHDENVDCALSKGSLNPISPSEGLFIELKGALSI